MPSRTERLIHFVQMVVRVLVVTDKRLETMDARLGRMETVLARLDERTLSMSNEIDALKAAVSRMETAEKSMVVLLNGIAQLIRDNAANPAVLQLLADQINRDADDMVAAVQANTDADSRPSPSTQPIPGSGASALNPSIPDPTPSNPTPATTPNSGVRAPAQDPQNPGVPLGASQSGPEVVPPADSPLPPPEG